MLPSIFKYSDLSSSGMICCGDMKTSLTRARSTLCECVPGEPRIEYIIAHRAHRDWPVNKINHGQIEYKSVNISTTS